MVINHIMCTSKILTDLCSTKQRIKTTNIFVRVACSNLVVKMCWQNIKKDYLSINDAQSVRKEEQLNSKIISNKYQFHLKFMVILNVI